VNAYQRRQTVVVDVGGVKVGGAHPIVVQSMTNTDTPTSTPPRAGARAARRGQRAGAGDGQQRGCGRGRTGYRGRRGRPGDRRLPLQRHLLLTKYPKCAAALAKYRINPGNVGAKRRDEHFRTIIEVALSHGKPVRIGVNWGSLDQQLLTEMMDENARRPEPLDAREVMIEAMLASALRSAELAEECGLAHDRIILSAKVSAFRIWWT